MNEGNSFFEQLQDTNIAATKQHAERQEYAANEAIFAEGAQGKVAYQDKLDLIQEIHKYCLILLVS